MGHSIENSIQCTCLLNLDPTRKHLKDGELPNQRVLLVSQSFSAQPVQLRRENRQQFMQMKLQSNATKLFLNSVVER
jgi:hypothetical protein